MSRWLPNQNGLPSPLPSSFPCSFARWLAGWGPANVDRGECFKTFSKQQPQTLSANAVEAAGGQFRSKRRHPPHPFILFFIFTIYLFCASLALLNAPPQEEEEEERASCLQI